jgi:membrane protein implicated in regulation of membrane protease activity
MVSSAGLLALWWVSLLAPVVGLAVLWLLPLKPAVTVYVVVATASVVLQKWVDELRRSRRIDEIARRAVNDYYAR